MLLRRFSPIAFALVAASFFFLISCVSYSPDGKSVVTSRGGKSLSIIKKMIPLGNLNRRDPKRMKPRYITIHSTANPSPTADAEAHMRLLHNAGRGRLSWHFSVDEDSIYQTLPTTEQGQHADYQGPGNRYSIGIEMCENKGNSREKTLEQTAKLTAYLMEKHDIPISKVVPHYHWRRVRSDGKDYGHKACPGFLMDNGKPGKKWKAFLQRVKCYQ